MKQLILEAVNDANYKPLKVKVLSKKLGITKRRWKTFEAALQELVEYRKVQISSSGRVKPKVSSSSRNSRKPNTLSGRMKRTASGAGYVILSEPKPKELTEDVYIDFRDVKDAQTGDQVLIELTQKRRSQGARCGRVVKVLERASNAFVGTYFEENAVGYVQIDGSQFPEPIWVGDPGAKGVKNDDKVLIEMVRFPSAFRTGEAVLTKVLGARGAIGVDTLTIISEYGIPDHFSEAVLEDAAKQTTQFDETNLKDRLDLTKEMVITIDPADARDFDDAISLTRDDKGFWSLGVHIADVAHFVQTGSPLDKEAVRRGTSVYLPTKVVPMLPEVLSNGLASLQQGKVRFVKSVFIDFDPQGRPVGTRLARSAIKVRQRFSYEQIMTFLIEQKVETEGIDDFEAVKVKPANKKVSDLILQMHELSMLLRSRRFQAGSIELSMPEVRLRFNKKGQVSGAYESRHDVSHQMIEEFMLAANVAVAQEFKDRGIPFLRRVHDSPRVEKMTAFAEFVQALGYELEHAQSRPELQALLESVHGQPDAYAVNFAFLRSLKQAEYSPVEMGHYALAVEHYCHFTSPIRRYPDLTIHRIVDDILDGKKRPGRTSDDELVRLGEHCSSTSRRAERAERELTKLKLLQYMETRVGDDFEAVITGVERFGVFCQCVEVPAEGLIHISSLAETDQFQLSQETRTLQGRQSGRTLRLGDHIKVRVAHVDLDRRELDFTLMQFAPNSASRAASRTKKKKTTSTRTTSKRTDSNQSSRKKPSSKGKKKSSAQVHSKNKKRNKKTNKKKSSQKRKGKKKR